MPSKDLTFCLLDLERNCCALMLKEQPHHMPKDSMVQHNTHTIAHYTLEESPGRNQQTLEQRRQNESHLCAFQIWALHTSDEEGLVKTRGVIWKTQP